MGFRIAYKGSYKLSYGIGLSNLSLFALVITEALAGYDGTIGA